MLFLLIQTLKEKALALQIAAYSLTNNRDESRLKWLFDNAELAQKEYNSAALKLISYLTDELQTETDKQLEYTLNQYEEKYPEYIMKKAKPEKQKVSAIPLKEDELPF